MRIMAAYSVAGLLAALTSASGAYAEPACQPRDLGTLGGYGTDVMDMNDHGQIVGRSDLITSDSPAPSQDWHAFLWDDDEITDLGALPGEFRSQALGINDRGTIVGSSGDHAVIWQDGAIARLPYEGEEDDQPVALDINNRGQIVGYVCCDMCLLWPDASREPIRFTGPGGSCQPNAINDAGVVVGSANFGRADYRGFVWKDGKMQAGESIERAPLDEDAMFDNRDSELVAVNDSGLAIGFVNAGGGRAGPLVWDPRRGGRILRAEYAQPGAVNDWGVIALITGPSEERTLTLADTRGGWLSVGDLDPLYTDGWLSMNNRFQIAWSAQPTVGLPARGYTCQLPIRRVLDLVFRSSSQTHSRP